jgi:peptidoglycan glycosyltransferase
MRTHPDPGQQILLSASWRTYQNQLRRSQIKRRILRWTLVATALIMLLLPVFASLNRSPETVPAHPPRLSRARTAGSHPVPAPFLKKNQIPDLLADRSMLNLSQPCLIADLQGRPVQVETSIDADLQQALIEHLDRVNSRYIGIVAMDPDTGRVLAMVGFDKYRPGDNPCLDQNFPAASLFKIVTATAAVETQGFEPESQLNFTGGKYTLYRSQLKDSKGRYSHEVSFRDSFALSINPVFGKIGSRLLGKQTLENYATCFRFNQPLAFDLPVAPSQIAFPDDTYHLAEVSCGFNRTTRITPLHGAAITALILNRGRWITPSIVDRIVDDTGRVLYQVKSSAGPQAISAEASQVVQTMMKATVRSGTAHKTFRGYRKDPVLSRLTLGGKTGSIDNADHQTRYDWFVGFAKNDTGPKKLVVAVLVAHEKFIGVRASQYAKLAFQTFFKDYFTRADAAQATQNG